MIISVRGGRPRLEKFQGKPCFQGKRKLLKNPEWQTICIQYSEFRAHSVTVLTENFYVERLSPTFLIWGLWFFEWKQHIFLGNMKTCFSPKRRQNDVTYARNQGCGVGGKTSDSNSDLFPISDSDYPKFPTPTRAFAKFPTPDPDSSTWREWNFAVNVNGNRGAQQEISVSTKVSKEIVPFQKEIPMEKWSSWTSGVGVGQKYPTPSVVRNPTPDDSATLHATYLKWFVAVFRIRRYFHLLSLAQPVQELWPIITSQIWNGCSRRKSIHFA